MATFDYAEMQAVAEELIAEFGMVGTIIRDTKTGPAYNPSIIPTPYPCTLVVLDYEDDRIDGTLIKRTDKLIYVAASNLPINIEESDRVAAIDTYAIIRSKPLSPAGMTVYYEIQGRR